MNRLSGTIVLLAFLTIWATSCKKDEPENPYEEIVMVINDNPDPEDIPTGNFAWIHGKVFKPTCANSGCHDGTFEPKFNTISSAYNSLVNHPVIANDAFNTFEYRVVPGNSEASFLHERLTVDIPNTSGMMPLSVDDDSDWPLNGNFYINEIKAWIDAGAIDMYGNAPPSANADFPPQVDGFVVFPSGNTTTPYPRDEDGTGITPILIDAGLVDLWILATDDNTPTQDFQNTSIKVATSIEQFETADEYPLVFAGPVSALDFSDNTANFEYKATADFSGASSGDTFFVRSYWDDTVQTSITEIPTDGSSAVITAIFVLKVE